MGLNHSAYTRYRIINRELTNGKRARFTDLKDACEDALGIKLGKRTIEEDIRKMRYADDLGFMAPIIFDRADKCYSYSNPNYSIDKRDITDEEIQLIKEASKLIQQFHGISLFKPFSNTLNSLFEKIGIFTDNDFDTVNDKIEFEQTEDKIGQNYLTEIVKALSPGTVLRIKYQSFHSSEEENYFVHPLYLKEYRNRWYLIAYNDKKKEVRTYALDRLISVKPAHDRIFKNVAFSPKEYYKDTVGITVSDEKPIEIVLSFTKFQAKYLFTQPLHSSQELIKETEDEVIFKYKVRPTFEFDSQIVGWGDQVKVLEPKEYQDKIKGFLERALKQY